MGVDKKSLFCYSRLDMPERFISSVIRKFRRRDEMPQVPVQEKTAESELPELNTARALNSTEYGRVWEYVGKHDLKTPGVIR